MGWLKQGTATYAGEPGYDEAVKHIRQHAAIQFIREYKASPPASTAPPATTATTSQTSSYWTWGDELEHLLLQLRLDTEPTTLVDKAGACQLDSSSEPLHSNVALAAHSLLPRMQAVTVGATGLWSPEYADFQIESSPVAPYDTSLAGLCAVEPNMRQRIISLNEELRRWGESQTKSISHPISMRTASLTCFWFLGAAAARFPSGGSLTELEELQNTVTGSCFLSDTLIAPHPRMTAVTLGVLHNKWRLFDEVFRKAVAEGGDQGEGLRLPPQLNITPLFIDERTLGYEGQNGGSPVDPVLLVDRHPNNDRLLKRVQRLKDALSQSALECSAPERSQIGTGTPSTGSAGAEVVNGARLEVQELTEGDISTANTSFQRVLPPFDDPRAGGWPPQIGRTKVMQNTLTDLNASQNSFVGDTENSSALPAAYSSGPGKQERSLGSDQDATPAVLSPPISRDDTPGAGASAGVAISPSRRGSTAAAAQLYSPTRNHSTSVIYSHYTTPAQSRRGSKTVTPDEPETFDARTHLSQRYLQDLLLHRQEQASKVPAHEGKGLPLNSAPSLGPVILMDSIVFGPTMCCLQFTVELRTQSEARRAADFLLILSPLMLALSSATPFQKGLLRDCDVRWSTLSQSMDDRLEGKPGSSSSDTATAEAKGEKKAFHKSRYDSCSLFVSDLLAEEELSLLNDVEVVVDEESKDELIRSGVDAAMAHYIAHLFARQPIVVYQNFLNSVDDRWQSDHFANLQSSNYHTVRLKPPTRILAKGTDEAVEPATVQASGWRVEFRPMEIQPTPFENAAFCVFCVLLLQEVIECGLESCFYMPVSLIDRNMEQAHHRSPLEGEFFWARTDNLGGSAEDAVAPTSIADIFLRPNNGLLVLTRRRLLKLKQAGGVTETSAVPLEQYLDFFEARVKRKIPTVAEYLRSRVRGHPLYQNQLNSVVPPRVGEELLKEMLDAADAEAPWLRLPWLIPSC